MQSVSEKIFNTAGESLYDNYSSIVYRIALKISLDKKRAEEILISTFKKLYKQTSTEYNHQSFRIITLIRLVIQTAHEHLDLNEPIFFRLNQKAGNKSKEKINNNNPTESDLKIDKLFCNSAGFHR
jgi:hypothetical protein